VAAARLLAEHPELSSTAALLSAGADPNDGQDARGRGDAPVEDEWLTALHAAAREGNVALAERLLEPLT
jgi:hypothetical protein